MLILDENFRWHLEAFSSELFICLSCIFYLFKTFKNINKSQQPQILM